MRKGRGSFNIVLLLAGAIAESCDSPVSGDDLKGGSPTDTGADLLPDIQPEAVECTDECGEMVEVAAASFTMGCVSGPAASGCKPDEKPSHSVNVPAFRIDRDEATVAMWSHCVSDGACTLPNQSSALCNYGAAGKEQHPINCISWDQARAFCSWAGKRLCSEAEWELAAVGSDGRTYPWGDDAPTCERAVLDQEEFGCGTGSTFPVGSKPEGDSPYGARDMIGNVWEWVEDFYHDDYENAPSDGSAWLVPATEARVGRGGALSDKAVVLRASVRRSFNLRLDGYYLGVRCCEHVQP